MRPFVRTLLAAFALAIATSAGAADPPLRFGVGLFQPDREKNDATYRPLAQYLADTSRSRRRAEDRRHLGGPCEVPGQRRDRHGADGPMGLRAREPRSRCTGGLDDPVRRQARVLRDHRHAPRFGHQGAGRSERPHLRVRRQGLDVGLLDPAALLHEPGHRSGQVLREGAVHEASGDRDAGRARRARRGRRLQPQPQRDDRAGADQGRALEDHLAIGTAAQRRVRGQPRAAIRTRRSSASCRSRLPRSARRSPDSRRCCRRTTPASSRRTTPSTSRSAMPGSRPASCIRNDDGKRRSLAARAHPGALAFSCARRRVPRAGRAVPGDARRREASSRWVAIRGPTSSSLSASFRGRASSTCGSASASWNTAATTAHCCASRTGARSRRDSSARSAKRPGRRSASQRSARCSAR